MAINRNAEIIDMDLGNLIEYVELFVEVFNSEPWNDSWTKENTPKEFALSQILI